MKMQKHIKSALIILSLLLLQTTFISYISIAGFLPDLFILYLVYLAICRDQIESTVHGFLIGLLQDIFTIKFLGLAALSKTIASFIIGYFHNENIIEQTLASYRYVLLVILYSVIQNIIYFIIFFQGCEGSIILNVAEKTLGVTLYTTVISILPMFYFSRKFNISWSKWSK